MKIFLDSRTDSVRISDDSAPNQNQAGDWAEEWEEPPEADATGNEEPLRDLTVPDRMLHPARIGNPRFPEHEWQD